MDFEPGECKNLCGYRRPHHPSYLVHLSGQQNNSDEGAYTLRKLVLRIYWDDETEPSVEAPLGDFFGVGFGLLKAISAKPSRSIRRTVRGMNCYFPMPFAKRARLTLQNDCVNHCNFYFYGL